MKKGDIDGKKKIKKKKKSKEQRINNKLNKVTKYKQKLEIKQGIIKVEICKMIVVELIDLDLEKMKKILLVIIEEIQGIDIVIPRNLLEMRIFVLETIIKEVEILIMIENNQEIIKIETINIKIEMIEDKEMKAVIDTDPDKINITIAIETTIREEDQILGHSQKAHHLRFCQIDSMKINDVI